LTAKALNSLSMPMLYSFVTNGEVNAV